MRYRKFKYKQNSTPRPEKSLSRKNSLVMRSVGVDEDVFIIPSLPSGSKMIIDILSTWGDKFYVGLNGIELFGKDGNIVRVKHVIIKNFRYFIR